MLYMGCLGIENQKLKISGLTLCYRSHELVRGLSAAAKSPDRRWRSTTRKPSSRRCSHVSSFGSSNDKLEQASTPRPPVGAGIGALIQKAHVKLK